MKSAWQFPKTTLLQISTLLVCANLSFAQEAGEKQDYVKSWILGALASVMGRPGDIVVLLALLGICVAVYRKAFKTAAGFLFLACGIVILRIAISILFSGEVG